MLFVRLTNNILIVATLINKFSQTNFLSRKSQIFSFRNSTYFLPKIIDKTYFLKGIFILVLLIHNFI